MIRFSLRCDQAHEFEIWFGSNADFDEQRARGLVTCPTCGSSDVEKALMAPAIAKADAERAAPAVTGGPEGSRLALDPKRLEMLKTIREMVRQVRANSEDVGDRFPEEARRIHHGETEERGIVGRASAEDARALIEEGIGIAPLPDLPEDLN